MKTPSRLWKQADDETRADPSLHNPTFREAARTLRYIELMREHGHIIDREAPRCPSVDAFYQCTRDAGHDGYHESRSGCISAHRWSVGSPEPGAAP